MGKTVWGHMDESLEREIEEVVKRLRDMGISKPTKKEASALIALRNNLAFMSEDEVKQAIRQMRGL